ncbi:MAG: carbon-nitrogen hydrolase family protein [Myxococcales bacterium]
MNPVRIALANLPYPSSPTESLERALNVLPEAAAAGAAVVCFPEAYVPGYRCWPNRPRPAPDPAFLESAHAAVARAAGDAGIAVVLGSERMVAGKLRLTALVIAADGHVLGYQDKVQLDPGDEDATYEPGSERRLFQVGPLCFGIAICHEGFRYPETVRWAARRGAQLVFHPHYSEAEPGAFRPSSYADPRNSFHEKALLCRAAENTCFVASVNCAGEGSPTTSAVARPDGSLLCHQPYGVPGLLLADLDLGEATGTLAKRLRPGFD